MDSVRKRIIANLQQTVEAVDDIREVGFGSFDPSKYEKPCAGIIPDEEPGEIVTNDGARECEFKFKIRVCVEENFQTAGYELEDILPRAEKAILADGSRGGAALTTRLVSTRWLFLDREYPQAGADLELVVTYLRSEIDPYVG